MPPACTACCTPKSSTHWPRWPKASMGARDLPPLLDAEALVRSILREYLAPPPIITVTEWAERHRILSGKDSAEPGPYRAARTPYAREPMDALSQHSDVDEVVLQWGAQTSKTTIGSNWLGYLIDTNPGPVMIVQPTIDMAKRYSRQRLAPMIEESATLRRKVRENKSRDEANTTLLKEFAGGFCALAGANSAAGLRSMPVRDLFLDEIDAYPLDADGEGDPIKLAEARQTTFARRKTLLTSTPTTKDFSRVEQRYLASDRCRYHVPCAHCQTLQPLEWGADKAHGIKWDRDAQGAPLPETVRYVCRECGGEMREHHKPAMLAAGQWVADNPGAAAGRVRGFHLSSLYSPLGWLSWAALVMEWHRALEASRTGDLSLLRVFINTRLAETFEEQGDRADEHALRKRAADIPLRTVTWGHYVATLGGDVQGDRIEAYIWAWGRGMRRQLVDRAVFWGDPSLPEGTPGSPWTALTEYRRTPVLHASGRPVPIIAGMIDSGGHHTQAVYEYARRHQHAHIYAVKGSSIGGKAVLGKPSDQDINWRGNRIKGGVKLWPIGTDTAKSEIYGRLRTTEPGPGYVTLSRHLPAEVFEQLTSERLVTKYVKGRQKLEWIKPGGRRNEALDCGVYALAAAYFAGVDRWKEGDWHKWAVRIEEPSLFDQAETQAPAPTAAPGNVPPADGNVTPPANVTGNVTAPAPAAEPSATTEPSAEPAPPPADPTP
ncbi:MAG: phage terminase large subunit family protein, partial [Rhodoferax sp.]|nr:phage terminase large subunit family protein [Rhodoferax sp.]